MKMQWHHLVFDEEKQIGAGEYTFEYEIRTHGVAMVQLVGGRIARWREYEVESPLDWEKLAGETRIRSTRSGAENETDVDVNAIVNRIVKDECNKMKDQWAKDYKFARDMIVTNPVGPPSFANEPQQDKAYEAAPRPAAAGSAVDAATHRMIDRVVGEQVTHMINDVMWRHGLAFDQTTGRVNHRITQERRLAQDSRLRPRRFARSA